MSRDLQSTLRKGDRVADGRTRQLLRAAADAIDELLEYVQQQTCECFDEYGNKLNYRDLDGVSCDCDRCELLKKYRTASRENARPCCDVSGCGKIARSRVCWGHDESQQGNLCEEHLDILWSNLQANGNGRLNVLIQKHL